jgi:polysaccharide pyruvyl transferase WcaK-like protein
VTKALTGIPAALLDWLLAIKTLIGKDMLIVPGTGLLTDASSSSLGWPYDLFKWSLVAKLCRCKLVYVSVGAGPVYRPVSRWFITSALSAADFRSYRDSSSMEYLKGLGFSRDGDQVCPDLAFSLPKAMMPSARTHRRGRRVVGIGLMNDPGKLSTDKPTPAMHRAYLKKLAMFARWSLAHGYDVRLLIGDFAYDGAATDEFRELLNEDTSTRVDQTRIVDAPASSVEQLLSQLAETDVVVATRFHNVLLALLLGKPVIAVSFHHKCASLMDGLGLSEYAQDMNDLDVGGLIEQLGTLERNAESLKALTRQRADEYRKVLDDQYRTIFRDMGARARRLSVGPSAVPPQPAPDS